MPKSPTKNQVRVELNIKLVKLSEITPVCRQLVKRFYSRLLSQVQYEGKDSQNEPPPSQATAKDALTGGGKGKTRCESE